MCLLEYRFVILNGAFLVHVPGIKRRPRKTTQLKTVSQITSSRPGSNNTIISSGRLTETTNSEDSWKNSHIQRNSYLYQIITQDVMGRYRFNPRCRIHWCWSHCISHILRNHPHIVWSWRTQVVKLVDPPEGIFSPRPNLRLNLTENKHNDFRGTKLFCLFICTVLLNLSGSLNGFNSQNYLPRSIPCVCLSPQEPCRNLRKVPERK